MVLLSFSSTKNKQNTVRFASQQCPIQGFRGQTHGPLAPILFYLNSIHYFSLPHSRYQSLLYTVYHITFPSFQVYHSKSQGYTYPFRIVRLIYYGCVSFSEYYCDYSSNMAFLIHFLNVFFIITYAGDLYGAANAFCCGTRLTGSIDRCLLTGELLFRGFLWAPKNFEL